MRLIDADRLIAKYPTHKSLCQKVNEEPTYAGGAGGWLNWLGVNSDGEVYPCAVYCSVCGYVNDTETKYCPDCGADMRGKR